LSIDIIIKIGAYVGQLCAQDECARILLFRGVNKSLLSTRNRTASQEATLGGYEDLAVLIDNFRSEDVGQSSLQHVIVIIQLSTLCLKKGLRHYRL